MSALEHCRYCGTLVINQGLLCCDRKTIDNLRSRVKELEGESNNYRLMAMQQDGINETLRYEINLTCQAFHNEERNGNVLRSENDKLKRLIKDGLNITKCDAFPVEKLQRIVSEAERVIKLVEYSVQEEQGLLCPYCYYGDKHGHSDTCQIGKWLHENREINT